MFFIAWNEFQCIHPFRSKTGQSHISPMSTWCGKMGSGMEARTRWQLRLHISPMQRYSSFWSVNEETYKSQLNETRTITWPRKKRSKSQQSIITLNTLDILQQPLPRILDILHVISHVFVSINLIGCMSCKFWCGYRLKDHQEKSKHKKGVKISLGGTT
jgi:hypothetical protein